MPTPRGVLVFPVLIAEVPLILSPITGSDVWVNIARPSGCAKSPLVIPEGLASKTFSLLFPGFRSLRDQLPVRPHGGMAGSQRRDRMDRRAIRSRHV